VLSDIMTVIECKTAGDPAGLKGLKIAWIGDGNNMANSWIQAAGRLGFSLTLACPEGYEPDRDILRDNQPLAPITLMHDPVAAVVGAHVINTDVWASMGQEEELEARKKIFMPFQVNSALLGHARPDAIVLHCLPAHREEEITDEVLEGSQCVAFDQAENKMHIHKAILEHHLGGPRKTDDR
jgi:ornithine carbamoyltransferase